jgi:hypothetical protein
MNDKEFAKLAFIIGCGVFIYWMWERNQVAQADATQPQAPITTTSDPEQQVFEAGPPPIQSLGNLDVNISNQGLSYLSNAYMPLFGFVGMAQGVAYQ